MVERSRLRIDVLTNEGAAALRLWGQLDADTVGAQVSEAEQLMARGHRHLVIDCAAVTFCNSFGVAAMALLLDLAQPNGSMILDRPSKALTRMLIIAPCLGERFQASEGRLKASAQSQLEEPGPVDLPVARQWNLTEIEAQSLSECLGDALDDQVVIDQAKGVVSEQTGLDMEQCFSVLRDHAANHHVRLVDVAHDVVHGPSHTVTLDPLY